MPGRIAGLLCAASLLAVQAASAQSYFGGGQAASEAAEAPAFQLPASFSGLIHQIALWQRELNEALAVQVMAIRDTGALAPALALILLSFLYGVFHAAGPGHGKAVVATYFLANGSTVRRGILLGGLISLIQAVSAVSIVGIMALVLETSQLSVIQRSALLETVSYGLIAVLGAYMCVAALRGKECDHGPAGHDHRGHCGNAGASGDRSQPMVLLGLAVSTGLRPCTGALIILLFTLANGLFLLGVASTLMMSLGVAISVSTIGVLTILFRRKLLDVTEFRPGIQTWTIRALSVSGAAAITLLAGLLFAGALERGAII